MRSAFYANKFKINIMEIHELRKMNRSPQLDEPVIKPDFYNLLPDFITGCKKSFAKKYFEAGKMYILQDYLSHIETQPDFDELFNKEIKNLSELKI
jgi:hypothetical protein